VVGTSIFDLLTASVRQQPELLAAESTGLKHDREVVPGFVDLEVAVPHLSPAVW
jgi:hypothetical protein